MEKLLKIKTSWKVGGGCKEEEEALGGGEPVSPTAQYFSSSALSVTILGVLELEVPIDDSQFMVLLRGVFLPINPRFSSIMVIGNDGEKRWKRVEVKVEEHVKVATLPPGLPPECYDNHFNEYLSKLAADPLPKNRPLWELHVIKYPTNNAAGHVIFKLHHALGDGYSLMGALLSCLQRADNPSLPLTFPKLRRETNHAAVGWCTRVLTSAPKAVYVAYNTLCDYGWSLLKSSVIEDDKSPIRSGIEDLDHMPIEISTVDFSLDKIKLIKLELGVTVNDVVTGIINHGVRLYMKGRSENWAGSHTTALVLMNTRNITDGYKSVSEMVTPNKSTGEALWGNRFAFLHALVPDFPEEDGEFLDPLRFVFEASRTIQRKKSSLAVILIAQTLEIIRKWAGSEATSRFVRKTITNASMVISNIVGPVEKMEVANHTIKGLYCMSGGCPMSLVITVISYVDTLRIGVGVEKDFIDMKHFKSCLQKAFELTVNAVRNKERRIKSL